jgi:hypothetical protein
MTARVSLRLLTSLLSVVVAASAFAGECFEQDGVAIRGYDPTAYFAEMNQ